MTASELQQTLCDSIEVIVNKAVASASYDRTIQATITSCMDESLGYYKLRYQDSVIYAYALDADYTFAQGTSVYVLVPGNDFSNKKTILGTVSALGENYAVTIDPEDAYYTTGTNVIEDTTTNFALQSYRQDPYVIVLYSKDDEINRIGLDTIAAGEYLSKSESIKCGGVIRTDLPQDQQYKGDYGIVFGLDFYTDSGDITTNYYNLNVEQMSGQPYNYIEGSRQYAIFNIDSENFVDINKIFIYNKDFPNYKDDSQCTDDIWISAIELTGVNQIPNDELSGYSLTFLTPKGILFTSNDGSNDTLTIEARLRVGGKLVDIDAEGLSVYWFQEWPGLTISDLYYCSAGGIGWKCLNDYNVIQEAGTNQDAIVSWVPADKVLTLTKKDIYASETRYKCVINYPDNSGSNNVTVSVSNTFSIYRLDSSYIITITCDKDASNLLESDDTVNLTCETRDSMGSRYTNIDYEWVYTKSDGTEWLANENGIWTLNGVQDIKSGYVSGNTVTDIQINDIYLFKEYSCAGYSNGNFIGKDTITLTLGVPEEKEIFGTLILHNDSYVYKYTSNGVSPASNALLSPIVLQPLSFTFYDPKGNDQTEYVIEQERVEWFVPNTNSLIQISNTTSDETIDNYDGYRVVDPNKKEFVYLIRDIFNYNYTNNDIYLLVTYDSHTFIEKTNFTFVKDGDNGTNGTEYTCKVVPNKTTSSSDETIPQYLEIRGVSGSNSFYTNYSPDQYHFYCKVQVYRNEQLIYNDITANETLSDDEQEYITIDWDILRNTYDYSTQGKENNKDPSILGVDSLEDSNPGYIYVYSPCYMDDETSGTGAPALIIRAIVTIRDVKDDSKETVLYAGFPVLNALVPNNSYDIELKEHTGFLFGTYAADGTNPSYDTANPFELVVTYNNNDITDSCTFDWSVIGTVYDYRGTSLGWYDDCALQVASNAYQNKLEKYQRKIELTNVYDGWCVTNAVKCKVTYGSQSLSIIIPVYLILNRYGMSALNSWDGNSININEDGQYILAPMVGAGQKEDDNSFTGILMGTKKTYNSSNKTITDIGLFGFAKGEQSIFLDAQTGNATFGTIDSGQILIEVDSDKDENCQLVIQTGNYYDHSKEYPEEEQEDPGLGMQILMGGNSSPAIKWGNGNFEVNASGYLKARYGEIGWGTSVWSIGNNAIYQGPSYMLASKKGTYVGTDGFWLYNNSDNYSHFIKLTSNELMNGYLTTVGTFGKSMFTDILEGQIYFGSITTNYLNSNSTNSYFGVISESNIWARIAFLSMVTYNSSGSATVGTNGGLGFLTNGSRDLIFGTLGSKPTNSDDNKWAYYINTTGRSATADYGGNLTIVGLGGEELSFSPFSNTTWSKDDVNIFNGYVRMLDPVTMNSHLLIQGNLGINRFLRTYRDLTNTTAQNQTGTKTRNIGLVVVEPSLNSSTGSYSLYYAAGLGIPSLSSQASIGHVTQVSDSGDTWSLFCFYQEVFSNTNLDYDVLRSYSYYFGNTNGGTYVYGARISLYANSSINMYAKSNMNLQADSYISIYGSNSISIFAESSLFMYASKNIYLSTPSSSIIISAYALGGKISIYGYSSITIQGGFKTLIEGGTEGIILSNSLGSILLSAGTLNLYGQGGQSIKISATSSLILEGTSIQFNDSDGGHGNSTQPIYINTNGYISTCTPYSEAMVGSAKYANEAYHASYADYLTSGLEINIDLGGPKGDSAHPIYLTASNTFSQCNSIGSTNALYNIYADELYASTASFSSQVNINGVLYANKQTTYLSRTFINDVLSVYSDTVYFNSSCNSVYFNNNYTYFNGLQTSFDMQVDVGGPFNVHGTTYLGIGVTGASYNTDIHLCGWTEFKDSVYMSSALIFSGNTLSSGASLPGIKYSISSVSNGFLWTLGVPKSSIGIYSAGASTSISRYGLTYGLWLNGDTDYHLILGADVGYKIGYSSYSYSLLGSSSIGYLANIKLGAASYTHTYINGYSIWMNGTVYTNSDEQNKEHIQPLLISKIKNSIDENDDIIQVLNNFDSINPVSFNYKNHLSEEIKIGYLAQDIQKIQNKYKLVIEGDNPSNRNESILSSNDNEEDIFQNENNLDLEEQKEEEEESSTSLYLDYTQLIPLLHLKIKQLEQRIEQLEEDT